MVISTPNGNGAIIHEVVAGQTLWQIAISYNVKVDDVRRLNGLADDNIYPGDKLLIANLVAPTDTPTAASTSTRTPGPATTQTFVPTLTLAVAASTPAVADQPPANTTNVIIIMLGIIVLAIMGGGYFTWLGSSKEA